MRTIDNKNDNLHKYIWREESRLKNSNILNDNDGKCLFLNSSDKKIERIELLDPKFSDSNINSKESIVKKNFGDETNKTYSTEITKESHFECEEEWNIGGIPELLNELDADIEKSLTNIHVSNIDGAKHANGNRKEVLKQLQSKFICQEETTNNILRSDENLETTLNLEKINAKPLNSGNLTSTFAGFSKGGNLISSNSHTSYSSKISDKFNQRLKQKKYLNVNNCTISMSSQTGSNIISGSNISGPANNVNNSQASSGSNSNKQNKMSIDHQATLDKGLKMKIKRTKPGTKSSEAKHEIVKATEQLQNGLTASSTCTATQDDNSSLMSVSIQSTSSISQNSNVLLGASNNQGSNNSISNKKNLGSCINHSNIAISPSNNSSSILHNTSSANSVSQSTSQSAKRGSSGHRRDKVKEKPSHSNRSGLDKSSSTSTDKEQNEKTTCQCSAADNSLSVCSNSICTRKTESNTQRISNSNSSTIPPGVFTPSTETSNTVTVSTASPLTVTTTVSTTVSTQSLSLSGSANSPGPPSKDIITNSNNNIKISSHIAAQLAAAAASNNSSNGSNISASNYLNSDLKIPLSNASNQVVKQTAPGLISTTVHQTLPLQVPNSKNVTSVLPAKETGNSNSYIENSEPPTKRTKLVDSNIPSTSAPNTKEMTDICVGTSVGTITDPDCLGPCEPGTSVTLEGIVWHETEGGVLVVNVTWRGKTYVGTLLDCTRHDWAPPRFCDSPTEDLESRTPKGRGKRGRAAITPDLSNFTETRSSIYFSHSHVHSKLRNGSAKNGRGASRTLSVPPPDKINTGSSLSSGNGGSTPSTSPTAFLPPRLEKRKSKDDSSPSPVSVDNEIINNNMANASGISIPANIGSDSSNQPQSLINPVTGLNVQISTKKFKTSPCAISPVLIECPEQDCSKKYTHVNGLRYHQSHAHGSTSLLDEDSIIETEEQITTPIPSPLSSTPSMTPNPIESVSNTQSKTVSQITTGPLSEDSNVIIKDEEALISQLEQTEKPTTSSEPLKTESSSTVSPSTVFSSGGSITAGTPNNGPKKQFDLISNTKVNLNTLISTESNTQEIEHQNPTGKSGLLLLGQGETKHNSSANITEAQTIAFESDRKSSDLSENDQHNADNESYCPNEESSSKQKQAQQNQSHQNVCSSKVSLVCKAKKNRKSPTPPDFDSIDLNTCNIIREDVQSPAYSDISDDSTPVNEQDSTDKQNSKSIDVIKKTQEIGITTGINPSNSQNNVSSTLGNYGVYQFYQQQQFIVPTTAEQQLSGKGGINSNIANTAISSNISQQHNISELTNKKDSSVDVISKANQLHSNQSCLEMNKEATRQLGSTQENNELQPLGSGALPNSTQSKAASHFYAFNYMPSNYPFNVEPNYAPNPSISATEDVSKVNRLPVMNSNDQQHLNAVLYKDDRLKEDASPTESAKLSQVVSKQNIKSDAIVKSESIKQEISCNTPSPMSQHVQIQTKDQQAIGAYPNVYQRHSLTLASQQLSRDEELRRYYIFSDQQRRQNNTQNILNQVPNSSTVSGNQNSKDDTGTSQLNNQHNQIKIKSGSSVSIVSKSGSTLSIAKESPKHKPEEDLKVIKQEGQKPTMETQGPPPPPTSQYFLHPSYIASTPFGFDPSHSMYRNVLMSATSPYNTPPYHLPIPRYHSPEDLSRNTGTKALDALHHAASQYYTTHKIHELSERALKSPNSTNPNNGPIAIKMSGTSSNIGTTQHSNLSSAIAGHHTLSNQPTSGNQLPHNLAPQAINISSKQDVISSKPQGNGSSMSGSSVNESQKQSGANTSLGTSSNSNNVSNVNSGNVSDSRSPPPQRHVHTHHHTHVGLGYPMYPAPYGAAVLASQQAAAVAVINPFPPGPNK